MLPSCPCVLLFTGVPGSSLPVIRSACCLDFYTVLALGFRAAKSSDPFCPTRLLFLRS